VSLALPEALYFTGIDWAAETHAVCVLDPREDRCQFSIEHSADGIAVLLRRLARYGEAGGMPVAIERPDGRLVDLLLEAGHPVVPVKSNAIKAWRDREVLSGAKSDAGDAAVIAEYLRLSAHKLTAAPPYSDQTWALRTLVRARADVVEMRVAATNQLAALLDAHWPGAKAISADLESKIALEFLTSYPTPASAARLGEKRIAAFCARHGYSGKRPARELLERLRSAPAGTTSQTVSAALRDAVLAARRPAGPDHRRQEPRPLRHRPPRGAPGREDLHVAAKVGSDQRRPGARRVGRLPGSIRRPRLHRRPRGSQPGYQPIRQTSRSTSAGPATSGSELRSPPSPTTAGTPAPGPRRSTTTPAPPAKTTARHPQPRPRLDPRHLPMLDRPHPLRPRPAHRRSRPCQKIGRANSRLRSTRSVMCLPACLHRGGAERPMRRWRFRAHRARLWPTCADPS
jgi:hypothetical protein